MYILSVDTTAKTATTALSEERDGKLFPLCDVRLNGTLTHSESILPMIDFCLKNAKVALSEVGVLAISVGPGSFTGVRIGVSTVKGLAFANRDAKCVPVSALLALAENVSDSPCGTIVCACMDARRNQFYNAVFSVCENQMLERLCADRAIDAEELYLELSQKYRNSNIVLVGDGAVLAYELFKDKDGFGDMNVCFARGDRLLQDALSVARCAYLNLENSVLPENLNPVYLRLSQAERERNERLGISQ